MEFLRSINAIDSHTMGEPTRIVTGGIPNIKGDTMAEKKAYLEQNLDYVRTAIMLEPRGHNDMFGSIITQPCNPEADFGIIFMDGGGYLNMCGHGSIGAITAAIETGMVEKKAPVTHVVMDTPAGIVRAEAKVENNRVKEVSIVNVPAFLYKKDVQIEMPEIGTVTFDISFGGSFFAIVKASELGLKVEPKNAQKLTEIGLKMRDIINETIGTGTLIIRKLAAETKNLLKGSTIGIYKDKDCKELYLKIVTSTIPEEISNIPTGEYYVKELKAPSGYLLNTETYHIEISKNKRVCPTVHPLFFLYSMLYAFVRPTKR